MMDTLDAHKLLWERMQSLLQKKRLPHAFLFVGPRHAGIQQFANRLMAVLLCEQSETTPCGQCRPCHMTCSGLHPDIHYVLQETSTGIKIDQIRELQLGAHQTPQQGSRRFIVINPADKMNIAAANALLKLLEEPPSHTTFILIAEQISSIPATILSRCQKYIFSAPVSATSADYLSDGELYPQESNRAVLFEQKTEMMMAPLHLVEEKISPCTLASQWSTHALDDLLWLLYLMTAQAINDQLTFSSVHPERAQHYSLSCLLQPANLFQQLERINAIRDKINHNINMNHTLVLEDLLMGYLAV